MNEKGPNNFEDLHVPRKGIKELEEIFQIEKSPFKEAYVLLDAKTPLELNTLYVDQDQILFKSGKWDYENPELITNKVKALLENTPTEGLTEEEREWRQEILWFWYHHAISVAVQHKDKEKAQFFAQKALEEQPKDHPNKITQLMAYLVHDDLEAAKKWAEGVEGEPEKSTAASLIQWYQEGLFF